MKNNQDKDKEVIGSLIESSLALASKPNSQVELITTEDSLVIEEVASIDQLVKDIVKSKAHLFILEKSKGGKNNIRHTWLGNKVIYCMNHSVYDIINSFPVHRFNPYVNLFISNVNNSQVRERLLTISVYKSNKLRFVSDKFVEQGVEMLNELIDSIRLSAKSKEFKTTIDNYKRLQRQNEKSVTEYVDALFKRHSRLLVLRIDFSYENDNSCLSKSKRSEMYLTVKKDREHFFSNMRTNALFDHMVGYMCKLEYGLMKGFHYHMIFFFDGSERHKDVHIANEIGAYWKTITDNRGIYHNCNAKKESYLHLGVGMINHDETDFIENLKHKVAVYLVKTEYYIKMYTPGNDRTFFRGEMPKPKIKSGRPRKTQAPTSLPEAL